MKIFPQLKRTDSLQETVKSLREAYNFMSRERQSDVKDFDNLQNRFMAGRKVGKIPSDSNDVDANDRLGDFNYTDDTYYILVLDGTDAKWRSFALATF